MKKISALPILFLVINLILISCSKDEVVEPQPIVTNNTNNVVKVYAGVYDSTFNYYEFQPNFYIPIVWDSQILYGTGFDSLDIDFNGSFDVFVTLSVLNYDSLHLLVGLPNPFPNCGFSTSSEFDCAFYTETFPIGLGQFSSVSFVDRLDFNERVDDKTDWRYQGKMWQENPTSTMPFGDWSSASSTYYIGIKKGNKYGWIEVDASNSKDPKFISYAIQQ